MALGAFLFQMQSILDGCDGEMSRVSYRGSLTGEWLDTVGDDLTNYGFFAGAAWGLHAATGQTLYLAAGAVTVACGLLASGIEYRYLIRIGSGDLLKYPISAQTEASEGLFAKVQPLFKRDTFVFVTFLAALAHALGPMLIVFSLGGIGIVIGVLKAELRMAREREGEPAMTLARSGAWWRALLTVAALGSWASNARAAGPLGPDGSPIATSNYRVDLSQGVVLGGNRVLGWPAPTWPSPRASTATRRTRRPAVRRPISFDHLDYDLGFGLTFPAAVRGNDLFNSGDKTTLSRNQKSALFIDIGGNLQIGRWGVGPTASYMQFQLAPQGQNLGLTSRFGGLRLQIARAFADGQLVLGVGSRGTGLVVERENPSGGSTQLFNIEGADAEFGTLWRPNDQPFRIGAAVRSAVITNDLTTDVPKDALGDRVLKVGSTNIFLPNAVALPWEISVGLALQVGRPFNPRWVDPDEALARLDRYLRWRELGARAGASTCSPRRSAPAETWTRLSRHRRRSSDRGRHRRAAPRAERARRARRAPPPLPRDEALLRAGEQLADHRRPGARSGRRRVLHRRTGAALGTQGHLLAAPGPGERGRPGLAQDPRRHLRRAHSLRVPEGQSPLARHDGLRRQAVPLDGVRPVRRRHRVACRRGPGRGAQLLLLERERRGLALRTG
ncbi:MAG: hypothetical protein U0263_36255 [Polyangiaceae bacterium]